MVWTKWSFPSRVYNTSTVTYRASVTCYRLCCEGDYGDYKEIKKTTTTTTKKNTRKRKNWTEELKPQTGQKLTQFAPRMCGSLILC